MKKIRIIQNLSQDPNDPVLLMAKEKLPEVSIDEADAYLVIGGDGSMLDAIRRYSMFEKPIIGLNRGHIGFLMNEPSETVIEELANGSYYLVTQHLLAAELFYEDGRVDTKMAFNDIYFERSSPQTVRIVVTVNGNYVCDPDNPFVGDGIIVCTAAGSTAYNASAGAATFPLGSGVLGLTGICPAPWTQLKSLRLPEDSEIVFEPTETEKRPVRLLADGDQVNHPIARAVIKRSDTAVQIGFANSQDFGEKVKRLQLNDLVRKER